jgi:subtilase family serine protease
LKSLIDAGFTGAGHTIVIVDAFQSPTLPDDLDAFDANYLLPPRNAFFTQVAPDGLTPFDPNDLDMELWSGEINLDVEAAHVIAPGASIVLVLAKSNHGEDLLHALQYAVDQDLGDVISMSWGSNETCADAEGIAAFHDVFVQATRKQITLVTGSGDTGSALGSCDGASWTKAVSMPATDPLVTAIGGTTLSAASYCLPDLGCDPAQNPPPGTYFGEVVWSVAAAGIGSGGGFSSVFDEPPYQRSTVHDGNVRAVADAAWLADGFVFFIDGFVAVASGTSIGAPQWAAVVAIANQKAGRRLGFLNSALYQIGGEPHTSGASFHDVTSGNNAVVETDAAGNAVFIEGYNAAVGWDPTTGFGTPIGAPMIEYLIKKVSPGDGESAIATTTSHADQTPKRPARMKPFGR